MTDSSESPQNDETREREIDDLTATAGRLGVEVDMAEAAQWILAMSAAERESAMAEDAQAGIFGHRIALMDFDPQDLDALRRLAALVRAERRPEVESAIAIAGSSAQGRVQLFPGDTDFFERLNVRAESLDAARAVLRELMRATALRALGQPGIVLVEVNFGVYPVAVRERGVAHAAGDPISWTPADVARGALAVETANGEALVIRWDEVQAGLGWNYLGWIVADPAAGRIVWASNMLDVTWEDAAGQLVPLDGAIDPFFQEIYLEREAVPVFTKIVRQVAPDALQGYVRAMQGQAFHYTHVEPNYGKAAKRLYNLFRLTDELEAAAYVRELFDEPAAQLYQVPGLLDAVDVAHAPGSAIDRETVVRQIDQVIQAVIIAAGGTVAAEIVMALLRLRDSLYERAEAGAAWDAVLREVRARCSALVNEYFRVRLLGLPRIAAFVAELRAPASGE